MRVSRNMLLSSAALGSAMDQLQQRLAILLKEWDHVQFHIGRYDTLLFTMRGAAITAFSALLAVSAAQDVPVLMLFGTIPILMLWTMDAIHKNLQRKFIDRGGEIERYLSSASLSGDMDASRGLSIKVPAMSAKFDMPTRITSVLKEAALEHVLLVYFTLLIACVGSYYLLTSLQAPVAQATTG